MSGPGVKSGAQAFRGRSPCEPTLTAVALCRFPSPLRASASSSEVELTVGRIHMALWASQDRAPCLASAILLVTGEKLTSFPLVSGFPTRSPQPISVTKNGPRQVGAARPVDQGADSG